MVLSQCKALPVNSWWYWVTIGLVCLCPNRCSWWDCIYICKFRGNSSMRADKNNFVWQLFCQNNPYTPKKHIQLYHPNQKIQLKWHLSRLQHLLYINWLLIISRTIIKNLRLMSMLRSLGVISGSKKRWRDTTSPVISAEKLPPSVGFFSTINLFCVDNEPSLGSSFSHPIWWWLWWWSRWSEIWMQVKYIYWYA